jgi:3-deoxy-D-manno-octulosonic-acid transferase
MARGITPRVADRLPLTLRAYRGLSAAAAPLAGLLLSHRLKRNQEDPARVGERRGESGESRPEGPLVWLHGASVGELLAAISLVERLRAREVDVLVTSGTVTSAALAKERLPGDVIHQFIPLDTPLFVDRFLAHWRPSLAVFIESDLWPNLIIATAQSRIPLIIANGRLSEDSFQRWRALQKTAKALLGRFDLCLAQSSVDADRFARLGAHNVHVTGNLKVDVEPPPVDTDKLKALRNAIGNRRVVAAASTHPGEETAVIEAHRRLQKTFPGLLTIIAPRHAKRGTEIFDLANNAGLSAVTRSRGKLPKPTTAIYIADTMGELGLVYSLAPIVFIGGSLVDHGGQNPIEAIKLGAAVLHGPKIRNFAEIYAALDAAGGAEQIVDSDQLQMRIGAWLNDTSARDKAAEAGTKTVKRLSGALERTLSELEPYLLQLRLDRRITDA